MPYLDDFVREMLSTIRAVGTDLTTVEVKAGAGGLPKSIVETASAFANTDGGVIILGLDETADFAPIEIDAGKLASDLASACADQLDPPIRPHVDLVDIEGHTLVAAIVDELPPTQKPCFVKARGIERGSYVRTFDGDRSLSTYEVHVIQSSRGQPDDDCAVVVGAGIDALDAVLVSALIRRLRATRGQVFSSASDDEILAMMGVTTNRNGGSQVTVAGLLALGRFPQQFLPQLDVTFVVYPTVSGEPLNDGTRFLDNQSIDGPIPRMVAETLATLRRNMKRRSIVVGLGREDRWEYPEEALRELVANALMHRDYHPLADGTQVRVALYPDRLEVRAPVACMDQSRGKTSSPSRSPRRATLASPSFSRTSRSSRRVGQYARTEAPVSSPRQRHFETPAWSRHRSSTRFASSE